MRVISLEWLVKISTRLSLPPTPNSEPPKLLTTNAPRIESWTYLEDSSLDPKAYLLIRVSAGCIPTTTKVLSTLVMPCGE